MAAKIIQFPVRTKPKAAGPRVVEPAPSIWDDPRYGPTLRAFFATLREEAVKPPKKPAG